MKKIINYIKTNKVKSIIGLGVILSLLVVFISFSIAAPDPKYSFTYNSTGTNNNYSNNDPGSFSLTKSIKWIGHNRLKVTMNVNSKPMTNSSTSDILLVVDTSSFLDNDMLNDIKNSLISAASYINGANSNSRIGLIVFNSSYTKYDFTSDLNTINNNINSLSIGNNRSYTAAFSGIDDILTNRDTSRDLQVIFITTGLSNINRSSEIYKYEQLQDKYNLDINCIYYLTNKVLEQSYNYFSNEIVSSKGNLEVNIESLSMDSEVYDSFTIIDHYDTTSFVIDNLYAYNGSSEYTNYGKLVVTSAGTIEWVMDESDDSPFYTGTTAKLEYEIRLTGGSGNHLLNSESINVSKTLNQVNSSFTIEDSLSVGNGYYVTYTANAPSGCNPSGTFNTTHKDVYEAVTYPSDPTCSGYKFKEWKVVTEGVKTSKNGFIMPTKDVEVKATWSKVSITKSMDGDVNDAVPKAYTLFKKEANKADGVVKEYDTFFAGQGFSHQDKYDGSGDKKIYFFRSENDDQVSEILDMNNVIFAKHCWQMLRTTDTGGIKMIYNGEPEVGETGHEECQMNRGEHVGYGMLATEYTNVSGTRYYADDYEYDSITKEFSLDQDTAFSASWSTDYNDLIGKYTCNATNATDTCTTLYLIDDYLNSDVAYIMPLVSDSHYSQFGRMLYNRAHDSPAYFGYMYNVIYPAIKKSLGTTYYYFGSGYSYDYNSTTGRYEYSLVGEERKNYSGDISTTHYTCWSTSAGGKCNSLSYVYFHTASSKNMYYINLTDNRSVSSYLDEMLKDDNVNRYDSKIKFAIDKWYEHFMLPYPEYTSKLEDAVFCVDRSIKEIEGWSPTGKQAGTLKVNYYSDFLTKGNNLNCANITDRYSVENEKAQLKYPIGLIDIYEANISNFGIMKTGMVYSFAGPMTFYYGNVANYATMSADVAFYSGSNIAPTSSNKPGLRPAISLKAGTIFTSGDGSMSDPYRVD